MSDFINRLLREARIEIEEAQEEARKRIGSAQLLIDALEPPRPTPRRRYRAMSAEARELDAALRRGMEAREAELVRLGIQVLGSPTQLERGDRKIAFTTNAGEQDGP